ncbi:hypothetical protein FACS1894200_06220 [Spirochaetia bacterium]|nr:hypothetical protein FACS1894200_06220 [Spirochaetia bacterium]
MPGLRCWAGFEQGSSTGLAAGVYRSSKETRIIKGRIDILFEEAGLITVIDFKTDRGEDAGRHALQLGLYQQAVSDIFGKPVQCYVFFLRTGHAVDLTEDAQSALLGSY